MLNLHIWLKQWEYVVSINANCFEGQINMWQPLCLPLLILVWAWISNYFPYLLWGIITHPCTEFRQGSAKWHLKLGCGWIITLHSFVWVWLVIHGLNWNAGLANPCLLGNCDSQLISPWCRIYASVNWVSIGSGNGCLAPSHSLNQHWLVVNWTLRNKLQWN